MACCFVIFGVLYIVAVNAVPTTTAKLQTHMHTHARTYAHIHTRARAYINTRTHAHNSSQPSWSHYLKQVFHPKLPNGDYITQKYYLPFSYNLRTRSPYFLFAKRNLLQYSERTKKRIKNMNF